MARFGQVPAPAPGAQYAWSPSARLAPSLPVRMPLPPSNTAPVQSPYEVAHETLLKKAASWTDTDVRGLYVAAMTNQPYGDSRAEQVQRARPYISYEMQRRGFLVTADQCAPRTVEQSAMSMSTGSDISKAHKMGMIGGGVLLAASVALNFYYYRFWQKKV